MCILLNHFVAQVELKWYKLGVGRTQVKKHLVIPFCFHFTLWSYLLVWWFSFFFCMSLDCNLASKRDREMLVTPRAWWISACIGKQACPSLRTCTDQPGDQLNQMGRPSSVLQLSSQERNMMASDLHEHTSGPTGTSNCPPDYQL